MSNHRKRRLILFGVASLTVVVSGFLLKNHFTNKVRRFAEKKLSQQLEGPVTLGELDVSMTRPGIMLRNITLNSPKFGVRHLDIDQARVLISPIPAFYGKLTIHKLILGKVNLHLDLPLPQDDKPTKSKKRPWSNFSFDKFRLLRFTVKDLQLDEGSIVIVHQEQDWRLDLSTENIQVQRRKGDRYKLDSQLAGTLSVGKDEQLRKLDIEEASTTLSFYDNQLRLDKINFSSSAGELSADGDLFPKLNLRTKGSFDLKRFPLPIDLRGKLAFNTNLQGSSYYPIISGQLTGNNLYFQNIALDKVSTQFNYSPIKWVIDQLSIQHQSGNIMINAEIDPKSYRISSNVALSRFPIKTFNELLSSPLSEDKYTAKGRLDGEIRLVGQLNQYDPENISKAELQAKSLLRSFDLVVFRNGRPFVPLPTSEITLDLNKPQNGDWQLLDFQLLSEALNIRGEGIFPADENFTKNYELNFSGQAHNIWHQASHALKDVDGKVAFTFKHLMAPNRQNNSDLKVTSEQLYLWRHGNESAWKLDLSGQIENAQKWKISNLNISREDQEMQLVGEIDNTNNDLQLNNTNVQIKQFPLKAILAPFASNKANQKNSFGGLLTLNVNLHGRPQELSGNMNLDVSNFNWNDYSVDSVELIGKLNKGDLKIDKFLAIKDKATATINGSVSFSALTTDLSLKTENLDTIHLKPATDWLDANYSILVDTKLTGDIKNPSLEGSITVPKSNSKPWIVIDLGGEVKQPKLTLKFADNSSTLEYSQDSTTNIRATLIDFDMLQFIESLGGEIEKEFTSSFNGIATLSKTDNEENFQGHVFLDDVDFIYSNRTFLSVSGMNSKIENGDFYLLEGRIKGPNTNLLIDKDGSIRGPVNISAIKPFLPFFIRSEGIAYVDVKQVGPISDYGFTGTLEVSNAVTSFRYFPTVFENIRVSSKFVGKKIIVSQFSADAGNGSVNGYGNMEIPNWNEIQFDLHAEAQEIPTRLPEEFPSILSGTAHFTGPGNDATLAGDLTVNRARYTKRFDWRSRLLKFQSREADIDTVLLVDKLGRGVRFDLHLVAPDPVISIDNNLGKIFSTGDFRVLGKFPDVGLDGRFDVESGQVKFRGEEFNIDSGTVSFEKIYGLNPASLDIYASAKISEYNVTINIHSRDESIEVNLTSSPPLNETDILSLIALGDISGARIGSQQPGLTEGVAVDFVSGTLQDKVEEIGIIDRVQVVPAFSTEEGSTELRLLLGKNLTDHLEILYSTDLYNVGTNQEVQLKQHMDKNFSIFGGAKNRSAEERFDLGVDLEFSIDF